MKYLLAIVASVFAVKKFTNIENRSDYDIYIRYDQIHSYEKIVERESKLDISKKGISIGSKTSKTYELL